MEEKKIDKVINEATSISNVDQKKLDEKTLEVIKKALECKDESFFRKLYDLVMEEQNGKSK